MFSLTSQAERRMVSTLHRRFNVVLQRAVLELVLDRILEFVRQYLFRVTTTPSLVLKLKSAH